MIQPIQHSPGEELPDIDLSDPIDPDDNSLRAILLRIVQTASPPGPAQLKNVTVGYFFFCYSDRITFKTGAHTTHTQYIYFILYYV